MQHSHNKWLIGGAAIGALLASLVIGGQSDGGHSQHNTALPQPGPAFSAYIKSHESEESVVQAMNEQHLNHGETLTPASETTSSSETSNTLDTLSEITESYHYINELASAPSIDEPNPSII